MGFPRQEYQSELPLSPPGDLPDPGIKPTSLASPALAEGFLTTSTTWNSLSCLSLKYTCIIPPLLPPPLPPPWRQPSILSHLITAPVPHLPSSSLSATHRQRDLISDPVLMCTETSSGSHLPKSQSTPSPYKALPKLHSSQENKTTPGLGHRILAVLGLWPPIAPSHHVLVSFLLHPPRPALFRVLYWFLHLPGPPI